MAERMFIDHGGHEFNVPTPKEALRVQMPRFSPEDEPTALTRLSELAKTIRDLEEEVVILHDAISTNGDATASKNERLAQDILQKLPEAFHKNPFTKSKPITHEQILDLVPVLADMIKDLKFLKREEQDLVARLSPETQVARQASGQSRAKLRTGKIHLPKWINELVEPVSMEKAASIMGYRFYGPERVLGTFSPYVTETSISIPPMPFTHAELQEAEKLGCRLILRIDHIELFGEEKPLTMDLLIWRSQKEKGVTRTIEDVSVYLPDRYVINKGETAKWLKEQSSFQSETPRAGWFLVGPEKKLEQNTDNSFLHQTRSLRDQLAKIARPEELAECSDAQLEDIEAWGERDPRKMIELLSRLRINQQYRRTATEVVYDEMLYDALSLGGSSYEEREVDRPNERKEQTLTRDNDGNFITINWSRHYKRFERGVYSDEYRFIRSRVDIYRRHNPTDPFSMSRG